MKKTNEAFWWSLFSAGGVVSALVLPALIVVTGLLLPFAGGGEPAEQLASIHGLASFWIVKVALLGVILLSAVHAAHRIRHILMDLGLRHAPVPLMFLCYGGAVVLVGVGAWVLLSL